MWFKRSEKWETCRLGLPKVHTTKKNNAKTSDLQETLPLLISTTDDEKFNFIMQSTDWELFLSLMKMLRKITDLRGCVYVSLYS